VILDVRENGASGDGETKDTEAIQGTIDACEDAGGGTVYIPAGRYLSGTLDMRSNVILHLDGGAHLLASRDPSDYPETNVFLRAEGEEQMGVFGRGTVDGQTPEDLGRRPGREGEGRPRFRTRLVLIEQCENVRIRDVTLRNSDSWALHLRRCEDVVVDGLTVLNNYYRTNTDGINPDSSRNVRIANCNIIAGDDCICLKARDGYPCQDIVVTNCTTESIATAIKLGTESSGDFRDVLVSNCTVRNSTVGLGIYVKDGGTVERVTFSNISIRTLDNPTLVNAPRLANAIYPIFVDIERRTDSSPVGKIRDVTFSDIHISSDNGALIQGMKESAVEGLTLRDIDFDVNGPFDFSSRVKHAGGRANPDDDRISRYARKPSHITLANTRMFSVDGLRVRVDEQAYRRYGRSALGIYDSEDGSIGEVMRWPGSQTDAEPIVISENCSRVDSGSNS